MEVSISVQGGAALIPSRTTVTVQGNTTEQVEPLVQAATEAATKLSAAVTGGKMLVKGSPEIARVRESVEREQREEDTTVEQIVEIDNTREREIEYLYGLLESIAKPPHVRSALEKIEVRGLTLMQRIDEVLDAHKAGTLTEHDFGPVD